LDYEIKGRQSPPGTRESPDPDELRVCLRTIRFHLLRIKPPVRSLPQTLPEALIPLVDGRLILDPDAMLFIVRRVCVIAPDIHQIPVDADVLGMTEMGPLVIQDARDVEAFIDEGVKLRLLRRINKEVLEGEEGLDARNKLPDTRFVLPVRVVPGLAAGDHDPDAVLVVEPLAVVVQAAEESGKCGQEIWPGMVSFGTTII